MEKPERVGLLFPRSGQQVYVNVPAHWAHALRTGAVNEAIVRVEVNQHGTVTPCEEYGQEQ